MNLQHEDDGSQLYWRLTERLLVDPGVSRGTMMGLPCMRWDGAFFASLDRASHHLVVKLPTARVAELIASGTGQVFAPSNRPFREWVAIPRPDDVLWAALLDEAKAFAMAGSAAET